MVKNSQNVPQVLKASPRKPVRAIKAEDIIRQALKLPIVKVNRANFLRKELIRYYPKDVVDSAIIAIQEISKGYQRQKTSPGSPTDGSARKPRQYHVEAGVMI